MEKSDADRETSNKDRELQTLGVSVNDILVTFVEENNKQHFKDESDSQEKLNDTKDDLENNTVKHTSTFDKTFDKGFNMVPCENRQDTHELTEEKSIGEKIEKILRANCLI